MTFSKLPERPLAAQGQKNAIPHNNFNCRSHFFPGREFLGNMRTVSLSFVRLSSEERREEEGGRKEEGEGGAGWQQ